MSAGGLSYSGLVNHGKITLPSVDSWGNNMNILRDPPKSITTKRIDKVGETSSMTQMIEDSNNRASEAIQVYARGVNPFVSVSYDNNGNNGGQGSGSFVEGGQRSAKLPYTIMKDGAFRPPVLLQEDLLPLSRIPRGNFSVLSTPGFADFSRKMRSCGTAENTKEVKTDTLKACVRPTAVYKIERPASQPYEIKHVIQPSIKTSALSGIRSMDITQKYNGNPTKEIDNTPLHVKAQANFTHIRYVNNNEFNPDRYLQDSVSYNVASNISSIKNNVGNNEINPQRYIQDPVSYNVASNISSIKHNVANNEFNPDRYLQEPVSYNIASNISSIKHNVANNEFNPDRYLQQPVSYNVASNISSIKHNVANNEFNPDRYLQEPVSYNVASNISSIKHNVANNEFNPDRYLQQPVSYNVASNISSIKHDASKNEFNPDRYLQEPVSYNIASNISSIKHDASKNEFNPDRYLQEPVSYNVASNISSIKHDASKNEFNPDRYLQEPVSYNVASNISSIKHDASKNEFNPDRYLQEPVSYHVASNISSKNNYTSIEDIFDTSDIPIHEDIRHYSLLTPFSGVEQTKYFHDDILLSRTLPEYNVTTNFGNQAVYKRIEYDNEIELLRNTPITSLTSNPSTRSSIDHSSRNAHLPHKIKPGGYSIPGQIPMKVRIQNIPDQKESEKGRMNRMIIESMKGRFDKPSPFQKLD
jgi:hypothetical protein